MNDDLALGLQEHQRGRLAEAARRDRNVLRTQSDHAVSSTFLRQR
jgi:hypothetical protein